MEEPTQEKIPRRKSRTKKQGRNKPYPYEFRVRAVKLYLEEQYPASLIGSEMGISTETLYKWSKRYRQYGEEGLKDQFRRGAQHRKPSGVKKKILELKKKNPGFGSRRISDILKRFFLMSASTSTVRSTLSEAQLTQKARKKPKRNPDKPRFFERSTPNQLWQSDITQFRLGGKTAYLIGFIDDYSRYVTGLGLFRSQTAENVLEVYRSAVGEYGVCKEMLTDNGRQYTNWRGTTRFENELKKDKVKHFRSRPHHPMTLGKIERFWKTMLEEFLFRAQFTSFEEARERIRLWVKYYNHKRPHQGIGGLCPADRFFEIQHELRRTLEHGMQENTLEMALRGKPRDPFYMVGRMGDQSVVIRAEKGKVKMLVDGQEGVEKKELVYDLRKEDINHENEEKNPQDIRYAGETQSRTIALDGAAQCFGGVPAASDQLDAVGPVAEPGDGGDAQFAGAEGEGAAGGFERAAREAFGEEDEQPWQPGGEAGAAAEEHPGAARPEGNLMTGAVHEEKGQEENTAELAGSEPGQAESRDYYEGPMFSDDSN